jgi:hypothetical protein
LRFREGAGSLDFAVQLGEVLEGRGTGGVEVIAGFVVTREVHVARVAAGALEGLVPVLLEVAEAEVAGRDLDGVGGGGGVRGQGTGLRIGLRAPGTGLRDWLVEDLVFGDAEATDFEAEFGGFEAGVEAVLDQAAGGEDGVTVGGGQGAPGEGLDGLGEDVGKRFLVLEEGDVDGALGAGVEVAVVAVAVVVAAEGPVMAVAAVAEEILALAIGGRKAAGAGGLFFGNLILDHVVFLSLCAQKKKARARRA